MHHFIDLRLPFIHVHGVNGRGVNRCGGSPPTAAPVEVPIGAVTWRWCHCSSWTSWALMGLLHRQCYWAPLFILVIKYNVDIILNKYKVELWPSDSQLELQNGLYNVKLLQKLDQQKKMYQWPRTRNCNLRIISTTLTNWANRPFMQFWCVKCLYQPFKSYFVVPLESLPSTST
jgi:hypothetical protein